MDDPTARQLEIEEKEFYGEEDLEREQRRAEYDDWMMDVSRQDLDEKIGSNYDKFVDKHEHE